MLKRQSGRFVLTFIECYRLASDSAVTGDERHCIMGRPLSGLRASIFWDANPNAQILFYQLNFVRPFRTDVCRSSKFAGSSQVLTHLVSLCQALANGFCPGIARF